MKDNSTIKMNVNGRDINLLLIENHWFIGNPRDFGYDADIALIGNVYNSLENVFVRSVIEGASIELAMGLSFVSMKARLSYELHNIIEDGLGDRIKQRIKEDNLIDLYTSK